jgi:hypothetical protein
MKSLSVLLLSTLTLGTVVAGLQAFASQRAKRIKDLIGIVKKLYEANSRPLRAKMLIATCAFLSLMLTLLIHGGKVASQTSEAIPADVAVTTSDSVSVGVINNPISFRVYDYDGNGRETIRMRLNGQTLGLVTLTNAGTPFTITLQSGLNVLAITGVRDGNIDLPATVGIDFNSSQVTPGTPTSFKFDLTAGQLQRIRLRVVN